MTVKELIEQLQKIENQEMKVVVPEGGSEWVKEVDYVYIDEEFVQLDGYTF